MKTCTMCKQTLEDEAFVRKGFTKKGKIKLNSFCKECNKKYQREHYRRNKEDYIVKRKIHKARYRKEASDFVRKIKEATPCADCKNTYHFAVMDFDHLRDKQFVIANACSGGYTLERIKEEINKCEVVCSNCHRIRTYNRRMLPSSNG